MNTLELRNALENGILIEHHTAKYRWYVVRRGGTSEPMEYDGRFGKGFTTVCPDWKPSSNVSYITYYIYA